MARSGPIIVGIGAVIAVLAAAAVALGVRGSRWRARDAFSTLARLVRPSDDHPQWELLMQ